MNDTTDPARPAPRRLSSRAILLSIAAAVCLIAAVGFAGYRIGRAETSPAAEKPDACTDPKRALADLEDQKPRAANPEVTTSIIRTQANVILQNPSCFPADTRAGAQTVLDQQDQDAAAQAMCNASDRSWWEC